MMFSAPAWLFVTALAAAVVLLHMRRSRSQEVSSIWLWQRLQRATHPQTTWKSPRPSVLMILQLLAVVLLALALADPHRPVESDVPEHRIFVVDGSGSMQATDVAPNRHTAAKARLASLLASWRGRGGGRVSIVSATPSPRAVAVRYGPYDGIERAIERLEGSDGPADWRAVAALVRGLTDPAENTQVVLIGDGAGGDPGPRILEEANDLAVVSLTVGTPADNMKLAGASAEPLDVASGRWRLFGNVLASSGASRATELRVLFRAGDADAWQEYGAHEVVLEEGRGAFDFDITVPGPGTLELRLPDDMYTGDGAAWFSVSDSIRAARVLYVGDGSNSLTRALASVPHAEVTESAVLPEDSARYDIVVLDGVTVRSHPRTHTLWVGGARLESEARPNVLTDPSPSGWPDESTLVDPSWWTSLAIEEAFRLPRRPGSAVLLESAGAPLIQARATEWGYEVVLAFHPDRSSWPQHPGFPSFIANVVTLAVPGHGSALGAACALSRPCPIDPRLQHDGTTVRGPHGQDAELPSPFVPAQLEGDPAWAPTDFSAQFRPLRSGVYTVDSGADLHQIVVNGNGDDVNIAAEREGGDMVDIRSANANTRIRQGLLLVFVLILLGEGWLAGRGPERFLRKGGLSNENPLAGRRRALLALRLAAVAFAVVAFVDVAVPMPERRSHLVVVADTALADPASQDAVLRLASAAADGAAGEGGLASVNLIARSRDASSRDGLDARLQESASQPAGSLEAGLRLAAGSLLDAGGGRIVLASDGNEAVGSVATILPELRARGIPIDILPLWRLPPDDVVVETVHASPRLVLGDSFAVSAVVAAGRAGRAEVHVLRNGEAVLSRAVELRAGRNLISVEMSEDEPGTYLYEFLIASDSKGVSVNDRHGVVVDIAGMPRILLVTADETAGTSLANALEVQGLSAEIRAPGMVPSRLQDWLPFDVVALMNVPAIDLHSRQQEQLEQWVRDYGGGLLLLGGENTFGPGGYFQTPLERISPLSSKIPREAPEVALVFVLDRSGSMQRDEGRGTRLDIAKEAALSAIELLHEDSLAGVVVFDAEATTVLTPQPVSDHGAVQEALDPLVPGGGTSIYPALVEAFEQIRTVDSMTRHLVLMTDGLSQPGDFDAILEKITAEGITVSTVAIGTGADSVRLELMARAAGGAFHETRDFAALPSILSQEALMLSSTPVEERTVEPQRRVADAPMLAGLPRDLPPIHGYVSTTPKTEAEVLLYVLAEDGTEMPLLAWWRHGAGKVTALTTHATGEWTQAWEELPEYPLLWSQIFRAALRETSGPGLDLVLERRGDRVLVTAETHGAEGQIHSGPEFDAAYAPPESEVYRTLELWRDRAGIHHGSFIATEAGTYNVQVGTTERNAEASVHVPYSAAYASVEPDADRLRAIAAITGGRVMVAGQAPIYDPTWRWAFFPGWRLWSLIALSLVLLDLLIRYAFGIVESLAPTRLARRLRMRGAS